MLRLFTLVIVAITLIHVTEGASLKSNATDSIAKECTLSKCTRKCPYGYLKLNGCEVCKCYDPCNPSGKAILCGPNKRCFIDTKPNGTFVTRCGSPLSKRSNDACEQEKVIGNCMAAFPRFYYNSNTKKCEPFDYGGCGGNKNNFDTKETCEETCTN